MPTPPPPAPPAPAPPTAPQPVESDLWSYIQARRRERGAPQESATDAQEAERNANLAANLPRSATGAASADLRKGGGIFEIKRMGYDDAAFVFNGWNQDMGRTTPQLIEVQDLAAREGAAQRVRLLLPELHAVIDGVDRAAGLAAHVVRFFRAHEGRLST